MTESNERVEVIWTAEDEARLDEALARRAAKRRAAAPQAQPSDGWITSPDGLSRRLAAPDASAPCMPSAPTITLSVPQAQPSDQWAADLLGVPVDKLVSDEKYQRERNAPVKPQAQPSETMPRTDWEHERGQVLAARKLVCDLWQTFPATREAIESRTNTWFAWGVDRDSGYRGCAIEPSPQAQPAPADIDAHDPQACKFQAGGAPCVHWCGDPVCKPVRRVAPIADALAHLRNSISWMLHGKKDGPCIGVADMQTILAALAARSPEPAPAETLTQRLQQKCSDWKTYWRAPDAHGVNLSIEQATELLADALGVEVAIAEPVPISDADLDATISEIDSIAHNWYGGGLPDDPESVVAIRAVLRLLAEKGKPHD